MRPGQDVTMQPCSAPSFDLKQSNSKGQHPASGIPIWLSAKEKPTRNHHRYATCRPENAERSDLCVWEDLEAAWLMGTAGRRPKSCQITRRPRGPTAPPHGTGGTAQKSAILGELDSDSDSDRRSPAEKRTSPGGGGGAEWAPKRAEAI